MGEYTIKIPLDDDGFIRRQCPQCLREFKWHSGPTAEKPADWTDPAVFYCPRCGMSAEPDQWWTQEQADFTEQTLLGYGFQEVSEMIKETFRGTKGVTIGQGDEPEFPATLHELNDMIIVAPPCHPWEPVKVPEDATANVFCLICGEAFAA